MKFVDTSFWFALVDTDDTRHSSAIAIRDGGIGHALTTNMVVGETWTTIQRRMGHRLAVQFLDLLPTVPDLEIVALDSDSEGAAWTWLRRHDERHYSFIDATSFAVMRHRRIREALAFDDDFTAAGFVEVRAP